MIQSLLVSLIVSSELILRIDSLKFSFGQQLQGHENSQSETLLLDENNDNYLGEEDEEGLEEQIAAVLLLNWLGFVLEIHES